MKKFYGYQMITFAVKLLPLVTNIYSLLFCVGMLKTDLKTERLYSCGIQAFCPENDNLHVRQQRQAFFCCRRDIFF